MYKTNFTVWLNTVRLFDFELKTGNLHIRYMLYMHAIYCMYIVRTEIYT